MYLMESFRILTGGLDVKQLLRNSGCLIQTKDNL